MAVDVSVYNEIARNNDALTQCVSNAYTPCYNLGYANGVSAATTINNSGLACQQGIYPARLGCDLIAQPWCCCYWAAIPTLPSVTGGLFVCDGSYAQVGICCAWTVPAGAQFLRFQMWGAGAASKGVLCCGISIYGGSGAYASVIIPAIPGCVYTLCAGCSYCCYLVYNISHTVGSGCASFVNGYGLNNVCAEGGETSPWCWMKREKAINGVDNPDIASVCVILPNSNWTTGSLGRTPLGGYCMCSGGNFCFSGSCYTMGIHPFVTSCKTFRGNVTNATQCCHFVIGTPGSWASLGQTAGCYSFCSFAPPITCITCCCSSQSWTSLISPAYNCSGCMYISYPYQMQAPGPGKGGIPSMVSDGSNYNGFMGSAGAVCVQYL
jgi:hypothetical protein